MHKFRDLSSIAISAKTAVDFVDWACELSRYVVLLFVGLQDGEISAC